MTPPKPMVFAMVTVQLDKPETDRQKAFDEIRSLLSIGGPELDNSFGAIPNNGGKNEFVVLIEENLANKLKAEKNPHVTGVYKDSHFDPFMHGGFCNPPDMPPGGCIPPEPPKTRGGPRRNPKI
jgi:hypothetical protein